MLGQPTFLGSAPGNKPRQRRSAPTTHSDLSAAESALVTAPQRAPLRSKRSRVRVAPGPLRKSLPVRP